MPDCDAEPIPPEAESNYLAVHCDEWLGPEHPKGVWTPPTGKGRTHPTTTLHTARGCLHTARGRLHTARGEPVEPRHRRVAFGDMNGPSTGLS
ncbi:MAG: hypothetical protein WBC55_08185 [Dehalococcoidia bacterium]